MIIWNLKLKFNIWIQNKYNKTFNKYQKHENHSKLKCDLNEKNNNQKKVKLQSLDISGSCISLYG